ncbi:hypothetical protein A8145_05315 [Mesorhizobium loti]|uniref:Uncharacterized protein n=1 Tax=Rhizobium loti TaxID=381 RepID=A0AA91J583_RHILI|nr:hypothetical protein A8145_05315 [Mesorhizobium loti]
MAATWWRFLRGAENPCGWPAAEAAGWSSGRSRALADDIATAPGGFVDFPLAGRQLGFGVNELVVIGQHEPGGAEHVVGVPKCPDAIGC